MIPLPDTPSNGHTDGLFDPVTLQLPSVPPALAGLRMVQLTDLHVRGRRRRWERLAELLAATEHDLMLLTGDYMSTVGDEVDAHETLRQITLAAKPRMGAFGVFGNHDTPELRRRVEHLPVQWLNNRAWTHPRFPLTIAGVDCDKDEFGSPRGDLVAAINHRPPRDHDDFDPASNGSRGFTLLLSHLPNWLPAAAQMNVDLMLAGHTHGGQCRLPGPWVLYNATPGWPRRLSSGIYQRGRTLSLVSRGIGESWRDGFRLFCPAHVPLITLQRGTTPLDPAPHIRALARW